MFVEPRTVDVLRLQFGALGGWGGGGGMKHEAVQHCGGVVWPVQARILPVVAKTPNSPCHVCAVHAVPAVPKRPH